MKKHLFAFYSWLSRPLAALWGSLFFSLVWIVLGILSGFRDGPRTESLTWHSDYLGHSLAVLTAVSALIFWWYSMIVQTLVSGFATDVTRAEDKAIWTWSIPTTVLCLAYAAHNTWYVCQGRDGNVYWSQEFWPYWGPGIVGASYYLCALLPLLLNQIRHGFAMRTAIGQFRRLKDYDETSRTNRFGLEAFGDAAASSSLVIFLFLLVPLIIQVWQKDTVSPASIIGIPIGFLLTVHVAFLPIASLTMKLKAEKHRLIRQAKENLERIKQENGWSKEKTRAVNDAESTLTAYQDLRCVPLTRRSIAMGVLILTPATISAVLKWVEQIAKLLPEFGG